MTVTSETFTPNPTALAGTAELDHVFDEIDRVDAEIVAAIRRRTGLAHHAGRLRRAGHGTVPAHTRREMAVLARFTAALGRDGSALAATLLRLGRDPLADAATYGQD
ncbi:MULTISPECIES: chorismate mutase [Rhodococcus]|uniref:Chorismate mutase n=1 Tax=Rhodococcus aetherivorans TaxID=191292 RepID=A0A059MQ11_9NOCA|nr:MULTISPECIES: chorismate mutase [Rhodococcus]ETT24285.1 chorismate mutase [Rhodococcus rhodochrous ATCC 21198]AKE90359.1 chorismate mutase [Rhodococcus aetherivorans]ANZ24919.1 chorismate mutase [Rhodococcus sp. WB1]KDE13122.1 chorismate mutase [Rhodococcus aetherivorans]MDV6295023.1 chorismate mutase [Rhodococcus aetherivorans]